MRFDALLPGFVIIFMGVFFMHEDTDCMFFY